MYGHSYTQEQIDWLRINRPKMTKKEMAMLFAECFGVVIGPEALQQVCIRNGIQSTSDGRFKRGNVPHNAGKKHPLRGRSIETVFRKGQSPHNIVRIGTIAWKGRNYKKNEVGYLAVKIAEPAQWEYLHRRLWREHYGAIPVGSVIIFADNNRENLTIENLACLTRSELVRLNQMQYNQQPDELKPAILALAKLKSKAGELNKASRKSTG